MAWRSNLDQVRARLVDVVSCIVDLARKLDAGDACHRKTAHKGDINHQ